MQRRDFINKVGMLTAASAVSKFSMTDLHAAVKKVENIPPNILASEEDFWREIQQSFSASRSDLNLNSAGICCSPRIVTNASIEYTWEQEKVPAYTAFTTLEPRMETVRKGLAAMFGSDVEEIAIMRNATEALQAVLMGIPMQKGDEVLTTKHDYWAMLDALEQRKNRDGIIVTKVDVPLVPKSMDELVAIFENAITPRTKYILVCSLGNQTGQIFPIKRICDMAHAKGIEVVVDGAQSFGMLDEKIEELGCDYFGTSIHKWLMGPKVTGMLYVKKEKIEKLWPLLPPPPNLEKNIRKMEALGTMSAAPLAISEAISFHNGIGAKRKEERFRYLTHYWAKKLETIPKIIFYTSLSNEMSCAIATVGIEGVDPKKLQQYLWDKERLLVTTVRIKEVKGIRVSPGLHNTIEEMDRFCEIMERIAKKGIPA